MFLITVYLFLILTGYFFPPTLSCRSFSAVWYLRAFLHPQLGSNHPIASRFRFNSGLCLAHSRTQNPFFPPAIPWWSYSNVASRGHVAKSSFFSDRWSDVFSRYNEEFIVNYECLGPDATTQPQAIFLLLCLIAGIGFWWNAIFWVLPNMSFWCCTK